jgi:hypothetical protein
VPTLLSRSITIRMEKTAAETVDMWIAPFVVEDAAALRKRCATSAAEPARHDQPRRRGLVGAARGALLDGAAAEITARLDAFDHQATDQADSV